MSTRRAVRVATGLMALCVLTPTAAAAQDDLPATLGASTPEFQDDLSEPGQWGLPDGHGTTTDTDGAIDMSFTDSGWMWGWRDLTAAHHPVLRVEGAVALDGDDIGGGWMCGASDELFAFGIVDADDGWRIGHIVSGEVTVDQEGTLPDVLEGSDDAARMVSVECGQETIDVTRVLLRVNGSSVGSANVGPIGPFDRVAIVGTSDSGSGQARFDDIAAWTGSRYAPSDAAPSTAGPGPSTPVVEGVLGADTIAFTDDFSVPGLWGTGTSPEGFVSYADEQLAITVLADDAMRWSWRSVDDPVPVLRIEGSVRMAGQGGAGWMCGDGATDPSFLFGTIGTSGSWTVGQIANGQVTSLDTGTVASGPPGDVARDVALECGDLADGGSRALLWVDGDQVADVASEDTHGPFQKATATAGSSSPLLFNARFDDVVVSTGDEPAPAGP